MEWGQRATVCLEWWHAFGRGPREPRGTKSTKWLQNEDRTGPVCSFLPIAEGASLLLAFSLFLCSLHVLALILARDVPISLSRCLLTRYLSKPLVRSFLMLPPSPSFLLVLFPSPPSLSSFLVYFFLRQNFTL